MSFELLSGMYKLLDGLEAEELSSSILEESGIARSLEEIGIGQQFEIETIEGRNVLMNGDKVVDLQGAISKIESFGNLRGALSDMGVSEEVLNTRQIRRYTDSFKERWDNQPGNVDIQTVREFDSSGDSIEADTGAPDPQSVRDVEDVLSHNERLARDFEEKIDKLKSKVENGKTTTVGTWVKRTIVFGVGALTAALVFSEILKHRQEMNGCWLVDIRTGEKCKVLNMTCVRKETDERACGDLNVCGKDGLSPCFSPDTCVRRDSVSGNCLETIGKCSSGTCHAQCRGDSKLRLPPGKRLMCVDVNFWGAAEDFFDTVIGSAFNKKYLVIAGVVAFAIVAILLFAR